MTRMLVALAAASTLTLSIALAQSPAPSVGAADNASATAHMAKVIDQQKPDEWLASKFKGTDVLGVDGTKSEAWTTSCLIATVRSKPLSLGSADFLESVPRTSLSRSTTSKSSLARTATRIS